MPRRLALRIAVVWFVVALAAPVLSEADGDCGFDLHHHVTQCGCSCHIAGVVPPVTGVSPAHAVQLVPPPPAAGERERRERPALRPPIAG